MSETRKARQIEANKLDLEIYRTWLLAHRFADELPLGTDRDRVEEAARAILATRWHIRKHMHPKDREATQ